MKTGVYGYQEVQDMAAIDVEAQLAGELSYLHLCADPEAQARMHIMSNSMGTRAYNLIEDATKIRPLIANLIDVSRSILRTGLTFEDHKRLAAIMEKIK